MTWITSTVGECLAKVKRPGKLQTTDYQESGQFPIIDQGEGDIAGYTDQSEVVIQEPLPLVRMERNCCIPTAMIWIRRSSSTQ
jgi:type I restriction enzyme S subunit